MIPQKYILQLTIVLSLIITACGSDKLAQIEDLGKEAIVKREFVCDSLPTESCHASTLVECSKGELLAAWFGGSKEGAVDVKIWGARFTGGQWSKPSIMASSTDSAAGSPACSFPCWNPVLFAENPAHIYLFYKIGQWPTTWWGMMKESQDTGKTWSQPRRLPSGFFGPIKNKPIQINTSTLLIPSSVEGLSTVPAWNVRIEKWNIDSNRWTTTSIACGSENIAGIQPSFLIHKNGIIQVLGRTSKGAIFSSFSKDSGSNWTPLEALRLPNPDAGTDALSLSSGKHLLVYNHSTKNRTPLNLAISDNGIEWHIVLNLETTTGEYSYPAIIQTQDGLVHITYTWRRTKIRHLVVDPQKLVIQD